MENTTCNAVPTFESVWAMMQETDRFIQENARIQRENERILNEKFAETDRRMRAIQKEMGAWANNHGESTEEYFFNSLEKGGKNFSGEQFDKIKKNVTHFFQGVEDEYDIVMYNGDSVAIIEVKFRAHKDHISKLIKKAETFKILFPHYANYNIYLGLASMSFHPEVEEECLKQGIAIIKQVGESVVITDGHLKIW